MKKKSITYLYVAQRHASATIEPMVGAMVLHNPSGSILRPIRYLDLQLRLHFQSSWLLLIFIVTTTISRIHLPSITVLAF